MSAHGHPDVYVSARSSNSQHLTPRTRTLYAFSDTPAGNGALRDINQHINQGAAAPSDQVAGDARSHAHAVHVHLMHVHAHSPCMCIEDDQPIAFEALRAFLVCMLARSLACFLRVLACSPTCVRAHSLAYMRACSLTDLPTYLPTCIPTYLPGGRLRGPPSHVVVRHTQQPRRRCQRRRQRVDRPAPR